MIGSLDATTDLLSLLSDGTRLRLLSLLSVHELSVVELTQVTGLVQSRVSTHLRKLREAQVVTDRRVGASSLYRLNGAAMPRQAQRLWEMLRGDLSDAVLTHDRERAEAVVAAREQGGRWHERVAGEMERHYSPGRTWEAMAHAFVGFMDLQRVLDVGAGDGAIGALLAPHAERYVCLDQSPRLVDAAQRRLGHLPQVEFVQGDMQALPLDDASFDQVMLLNVLTYAESPQRALTEAARVLAPGGRLCVVTLDAHTHRDVTESYHHVHAGFSPAQLEVMIRDAGLSVRRCTVTSRERRPPHFQVVTAFACKPQV